MVSINCYMFQSRMSPSVGLCKQMNTSPTCQPRYWSPSLWRKM